MQGRCLICSNFLKIEKIFTLKLESQALKMNYNKWNNFIDWTGYENSQIHYRFRNFCTLRNLNHLLHVLWWGLEISSEPAVTDDIVLVCLISSLLHSVTSDIEPGWVWLLEPLYVYRVEYTLSIIFTMSYLCYYYFVSIWTVQSNR